MNFFVILLQNNPVTLKGEKNKKLKNIYAVPFTFVFVSLT